MKKKFSEELLSALSLCDPVRSAKSPSLGNSESTSCSPSLRLSRRAPSSSRVAGFACGVVWVRFFSLAIFSISWYRSSLCCFHWRYFIGVRLESSRSLSMSCSSASFAWNTFRAGILIYYDNIFEHIYVHVYTTVLLHLIGQMVWMHFL